MGKITLQYEGVPEVPLQEPEIIQPQEASEKKSLRKYIVIGVVILVFLAIIFLFVSSGGKEESERENNKVNLNGNGVCDTGENCFDNPLDCVCPQGKYCSSAEKVCIERGKVPIGEGQEGSLKGNGKCDIGENCFDDPVDCKCLDDEYCSDDKICVKPSCGNGKCEIYEAPDNCCLDCKCLMPNEICNFETRVCESPKMNLSEEAALVIVRTYFESQGLSIGEMFSEGVYRFGDKFVVQVVVQIAGEEFLRKVGVTEDGEVVEIPIL